MKYSFKDIVNSRDSEKRQIDKQDVWVFFFVRPISFFLTWVSINLGITANQATLISTIVSIIGSLLLISTNSIQILIGLIVLNFWIVFDCVDGNIARTKKQSSKYGEFLDGISGYIYTTLLYIFLGINVYLNSNTSSSWIFLVVGSITSISTLFPRLVEHKACNMFDNYQKEVTDRKNYSIFYIIGLNIAGMAGLSNPLMIIAYLIGKLNIYITIYCFIHFSIAILSVYKILKKVKSLNC